MLFVVYGLCLSMSALVSAIEFDDFFIKQARDTQWKPLPEVQLLLTKLDQKTLNALRQNDFVESRGEKIPHYLNGSSLLFRAINLNMPIKDSSNTIQDHRDLITALIDHGIDPNIKNDRDETAVYKLIDYNFSSFDYPEYTHDVLTQLLNAGATIDLSFKKFYFVKRAQQLSLYEPEVASLLMGDPPLMAALRASKKADNSDIIDALLEKPEERKKLNNNNDTSLHLATEYTYIDTEYLKELITRDSVNVQNKQGNTPLHTFITERLNKTIGFKIANPMLLKTLTALLEAGADLDIPNNAGETPRSILNRSYKGYPQTVTDFLDTRGITTVATTDLMHLAESLAALHKII